MTVQAKVELKGNNYICSQNGLSNGCPFLIVIYSCCEIIGYISFTNLAKIFA